MRVTYQPEYHMLTIRREPGDRRASTESHLLYQVKHALQHMYGLDLIKKPMWKDGHLVADTQHYLRSRTLRGTVLMIHDDYYATRSTCEDYNRGDAVTFRVDTATMKKGV